MMSHSFGNYLNRLSKAMTGTEVTGKNRRRLSLNTGLNRAANVISALSDSYHKMMLIGNGGSAAIVSHMQVDLTNSLHIPAITFTEPPVLTALSNDYGYEHGFERQINLYAQFGDLLLVVSSSGQSENIIRATWAAREGGCQIITFSGFSSDNPLRNLGDLNFYIPAHEYGLVELAHATLVHYLTDMIRRRKTATIQSELSSDELSDFTCL